jgi:hypothetical protein
MRTASNICFRLLGLLIGIEENVVLCLPVLAMLRLRAVTGFGIKLGSWHL